MRFAHISDLHLGMVDAAGDPLNVTQAVVADIASISEALDLVVVSGDLTEKGDCDAFEAFEDMFKRIGLPVIVVPGNHDGPAGMYDYSKSSAVFAEWNITNRVIDIAGVRFLGLDTCIEGATQGALDDQGLTLLEQEVARDCESRLVVVMHHPPLIIGLEQFDGFCRLEKGEKCLEILRSARKETIVLSGHVHRPYVARDRRIACFVAGSMVSPYDSALPFGAAPIRPTALQDFYYVHDIAGDHLHITTSQRVRGIAQ